MARLWVRSSFVVAWQVLWLLMRGLVCSCICVWDCDLHHGDYPGAAGDCDAAGGRGHAGGPNSSPARALCGERDHYRMPGGHPLPAGELAVCPLGVLIAYVEQAGQEYARRTEASALAKIEEEEKKASIAGDKKDQ